MEKSIKNSVSNNFWIRMLGEMCSAFLLIFVINFGQGIGEALARGSHNEWYNIFYYIYNWNIATAFWIGSFTFLSFLWFRKSSLSSNFFNLVISYKHNDINRKEFWSSIPFQLIGGLFAAVFIIVICLDIQPLEDNQTYAMGGTITSIKGFFINNIEYSRFENYLVYERWTSPENWKYEFAAIQGLINAITILFFYTANTIADRKSGKGTAFTFRYLLLVICIFFTTIFYANTTNWIRLISPAIVSAVNNWDTEYLTTTLVFIVVQTTGILVVYYIIDLERN